MLRTDEFDPRCPGYTIQLDVLLHVWLGLLSHILLLVTLCVAPCIAGALPLGAADPFIWVPVHNLAVRLNGDAVPCTSVGSTTIHGVDHPAGA